MPFPSRGCLTCKQRRVKCDGARPICGRCQKTKLVCEQVEDSGGLLFLDENEYAPGQRKRPRGPNVNKGHSIKSKPRSRILEDKRDDGISNTHETPLAKSSVLESQSPHVDFIVPTLNSPIDHQALSYYSTNYVEAPQTLSGILDGHLQCAVVEKCYSHPDSILSLAIFAVSHATFGRARKCHAALTTGYMKYAEALVKTNLALKHSEEAMEDDILLAVMLLSFYENSVTGKTSSDDPNQGREIQATASRSFAHHDGATAMLKLRRKAVQRTKSSLNLDRLVRRQLLRSLLLRSMPVPVWLRDGAQFGEEGLVLQFDRCVVRAAELRYKGNSLCLQLAMALSSEKKFLTDSLLALVMEAQELDSGLVSWANGLPLADRYTTHFPKERHYEKMLFDGTAHLYPSVGHAGLWNRYRAVRLAVNDVIIKISSVEHSEASVFAEAARLQTKLLGDDLCASIPYMFDMVQKQEVAGRDIVAFSRCPPVLKWSVKAATASSLAWPLAMTTVMDGISCRHQYYLRHRLLDVSDIVDDGVLERIATTSPNEKKSHDSTELAVSDSPHDFQQS